jgi:hypothetical protein
MVRTLSRAAVDGSLRAARLPVDTTLRLIGRADTTAVDRLDATLRAVAGVVLVDEELQRDAERRRVAADERDRAATLHAEAEQARQEADERLAEDKRRAAEQRREAAEGAEARKQEAAEQREQRKRKAAETEQRRKEVTEEAARKREEAIEEQAKRERLEQLDREAAVLDEKEEAHTAADEAQRLADAAGRAKAARKS